MPSRAHDIVARLLLCPTPPKSSFFEILLLDWSCNYCYPLLEQNAHQWRTCSSHCRHLHAQEYSPKPNHKIEEMKKRHSRGYIVLHASDMFLAQDSKAPVAAAIVV